MNIKVLRKKKWYVGKVVKKSVEFNVENNFGVGSKVLFCHIPQSNLNYDNCVVIPLCMTELVEELLKLNLNYNFNGFKVVTVPQLKKCVKPLRDGNGKVKVFLFGHKPTTL